MKSAKKNNAPEYIPERVDFRWFDPRELAELIIRLVTRARTTTTTKLRYQLTALYGGVARRGRQKAIVEWCLARDFGEVSLHGMRAVQIRLFGKAVANDLLCRHWTTEGRKADQKIDMAALLERADALKPDADALLAEIAAEWEAAKSIAAADANQRLGGSSD